MLLLLLNYIYVNLNYIKYIILFKCNSISYYQYNILNYSNLEIYIYIYLYIYI